MQTDHFVGADATRGKDWYARSSASVAKALGVNPDQGLTGVVAVAAVLVTLRRTRQPARAVF